MFYFRLLQLPHTTAPCNPPPAAICYERTWLTPPADHTRAILLSVTESYRLRRLQLIPRRIALRWQTNGQRRPRLAAWTLMEVDVGHEPVETRHAVGELEVRLQSAVNAATGVQ